MSAFRDTVHRARLAFGRYSGLVTFAGIAMIIVFGGKYIQHREALDHASPDTAMVAIVRGVTETTCVKRATTSIQSFNAQQRCLDVTTDMQIAPGRSEQRRIIVQQNSVGELRAGEQVYVVPASTAESGFLIIDAQDRLGFFLRQYAAAGYVLLGVLLIAGSFFIKPRAADPA